jgi:predicted PurR-regulated permease PerM
MLRPIEPGGVGRDAGGRTWPRVAAKVFVFTVIGTLLYIAHAAFIPVALALLLSVVLSGPVEALHRHHVPRSVSATLILVIALALIGGAINLLWGPAQDWFAKAPQTMASVRHKARPVTKFFSHLDDLRATAANIGPPAKAVAAPAAPVAVQTGPILILNVSAPIIAALLTFTIVTLFLLAGGPPMLARMTAAFANDLEASHVLKIIERVRNELGHFYLVTTLINIGLGTVTGLVMWAWGMPTPYLWGALAALLNYVPYAGPVTTLGVLTIVAVVSFNKLGPVFGVAGSYVVVAALEGQVVQPLLVGRHLQVNPLLIFLGLWFGGLYWGVAGVILATPTLVALKVISERAKSGKPMMEFLGPNDQAPERDDRLHQLVSKLES